MWRLVAATAFAFATVALVRKRRKVIKELDLSLAQYLSVEGFAHARIFLRCDDDVTLAIDRIHGYAIKWLEKTTSKFQNVSGFVAKCGKASIRGDIDTAVSGQVAPEVVLGDGCLIADRATVLGVVDVTKGSVFLGAGTCLEPGATVKGPCVVGENCELRAGCYVRGDVIVGSNVVMRGEIKNSIVLDGAEICHVSYIGDSIVGAKAHVAAHAVAANLPLFAGTKPLGRRKLGAVIGDGAQLGASAVTSPGVFLAKNTHVYPLAHVRPGSYGPDVILKHNGVVSNLII